MEPPNIPNDVESLRAHLLALEGKPDAALTRLAGKDDPESIFRRLSILLDNKRHAEAADLVRGREAHERWCEKAVTALAACGEFEEANRFVAWAHGQRDPNLWPSSLTALARCRYLRAVNGRTQDVPVLPGEFTPEEVEGVREALADVAPLVNALISTRRISSGNEATAVALAMEFHYWLGETEQCRGLADLLWSRHPIPLQFALAVLRGVISSPIDLPPRLRGERPESFEAKYMAAQIEGEKLERARDAIREAEILASQYRSQEHQKQIAQLLLALANKVPREESELVQERAVAMLGPESRSARLFAIETLVHARQLDEAEARLRELQDLTDPYWLQLAAAVREGRGDSSGAIDLLIQATDRFPNPEIMRQAATLAARAGRVEEATRLFHRLLAAQPNDLSARGQLALIYLQNSEYDKAAEQFHVLRKLDPDQPAHGINEALSLARTLRLEDSLRVYDALCADPAPRLEAILGRAFLLKSMNRPEQAFASLEAFRDAFWRFPAFVQVYTEMGFASRKEREAGEGIVHLQSLLAEGKVEGVMRAVPIDEVVQMMRGFRDNDQELHRQMIDGKVPWLLADQLTRTAAYEGWRNRTQRLPWLFDDPVNRAKHTIYATNGFGVIQPGDGRREAEPLRASARGKAAAIDLSAILTLHRLGLLEKAADYFGTLYVPKAYQEKAFLDIERLIPSSQPLRRDSYKAIKSALDQRRIRICDAESDMSLVDEYGYVKPEPRGNIYGLTSLRQGLSTSLPDDRALDEFDQIAHRSSKVGEAPQYFQPFTRIRIALTTLEALARHELLDAALSAFDVHVNKDDEDQLNVALSSWQERDELHDWHNALWNSLKDNPRFIFIPHVLPGALRGSEAENANETRLPWFPLFAAFLSDARRLPLVVDDRIVQSYVLNERSDASAAFGTDRLLVAFLESDLLTPDAAADCFLQLITWRYRFITVPAIILVTLARRNLRKPPGLALRRVARYAHDCLRDQGLFAGFEPTDPPVTMANKFFQSWATVATDFIMTIWGDNTFPIETARTLTDWAIAELLPSPPRSMGPNARMMAALLPRIVLSQAFIRSASIRDSDRANQGLKALSVGLGITDRQYFHQFAEVIDAF